MRKMYDVHKKKKRNCYIVGVFFFATGRPFIGYFVITRHLTMKLFAAKGHELVTLRMTSNGRQFTLEMLTAVAQDESAQFS